MQNNKKILICPLDWGLGHATRCIPIINNLLHYGFGVVVAGDNRPLLLLQKEFPQLEFIRFEGYDIKYPRGENMNIRMMLFAPLILYRIIKEHQILKKIIEQHKIDIVISDNRFGLWNGGVYSIYITHQVAIKVPRHFSIAGLILYKLHCFFIEKYDECWIPDNKGVDNLSGDLTHLKAIPMNASFIGILSRFSNLEFELQRILYDVVVVLSGPEPQRSILSKKIKEQLLITSLKALIVEGITEVYEEIILSENINVVTHLTQKNLAIKMKQAKLIVCRPGYSTLMDLSTLGLKAAFIPTPGQTEQLYLAEYMKEENCFYYENQNNFNIERMIEVSNNYKGLNTVPKNELLECKVKELFKSNKN